MKSKGLVKWTFGVCAVMAALAFVFVAGLPGGGDADRTRAAGGAETTARSSDAAPEVTDLSSGMPESDIPADSPPDPNRFAGGAQPGWTAIDEGAVEPERLPPRLETYTDARLVRLTGYLENLGPGSRVAFGIPHTGARLESVIERVESGLAGNVSYIGRVDRDDVLHRVVVTVGARNAFAFIASDQGSFEMVGNREFGWLMSTSGMERHVDYSEPDYYIPENSLRDRP
ncbi:MAG: hypothetical protein F4X09_08675 [Gammaproteobacteria bacterium]|nr:hypothetical protein [Gammaproteobacteria bacterium]MYC60249.1 hypothetical protein [Gammaproteobacteria bacterium]MYG95896.1 hypothetical protein [Gammaproteobacteria bacterium]MYH47396.1 hypothetical protein [Gammaproteobacteria bacterium]MYL12420.1 hypothetical protein [Gammaproteobacteria bacterium]